MAVTYDVQLKTKDSASHDHRGGQLDSLQVQAVTEYLVEVTDPADSGFDPRTIMATDVIDQPELPEVAKTIWLFNGRTVPYLTCLKKRAHRDIEKRGLFHVTAEWSTGSQNSSGGSSSPPANLSDYDPRYDFQLSETERSLTEDKDNAPYRSPSLSIYSEPLIETLSQQRFVVTQYEASITYDTMQTRHRSVNSATWRSKPAGEWMIEDVTATAVVVPLSGDTTTTAALVKYTIQQNTEGWTAKRACRDTHYLDAVSGDRIAFKDEAGETFVMGVINVTDGDKAADQTDTPDEKEFRNFDELDFNSFIQDEV